MSTITKIFSADISFRKRYIRRMAGVKILSERHELERQHFSERREEKEKGEVASLSGWRYVTG